MKKAFGILKRKDGKDGAKSSTVGGTPVAPKPTAAEAEKVAKFSEAPEIKNDEMTVRMAAALFFRFSRLAAPRVHCGRPGVDCAASMGGAP